ncbi:MAG: MBL fold metallo-hydrolase [Candidatus Caldatribacteriota bacterium]
MRAKVLYSKAGLATQILIEVEENYFLVDTGDGTLRDLLSLGIDFHNIKGIFLTHGHFDHIGGLYALLGYFRVIERRNEIKIYFPQKSQETKSIVFSFIKSYNDIPFPLYQYELKGGEEIELNNIKINTYWMKHYAAVGTNRILYPEPAIGYRFFWKGKSIAISGDTALCPGLKSLVQGADLALIDATLTKEEATEELLNKLHLSLEKAQEIGKLAKEFILIHQK